MLDDVVAHHWRPPRTGIAERLDSVRAISWLDRSRGSYGMVLLAHLFDHRLIAEARDCGEETRGLVRATSDLERDLEARLEALHRPGPVWDG